MSISRERALAAGQADDPWAVVDLARAATFKSSLVERGMRRYLELQGDPSQAEITDSHPLYGRAMGRWLAAGGAPEPGHGLLQLLQEKLRDAKVTIRGSR